MSYTRIMAGPGTGKTFTLMQHIQGFVKNGADPQKMLLVTFTRTAANDLKKSLAETSPQLESIHSGTLHSFCLDLLHNTAQLFVYTDRVPSIMFEFELKFLFEDIKHEAIGSLKELEKLLNAFEAAWAKEQDQEPGWASNEIEKNFATALRRWLVYHDSMLLSEIIPETLKYLRANPLSTALSKFNYMLVDEYQDLNRAEQSLIDILSKTSELTVVGDEDQSIYQTFRHAHPTGITNFHTSHSGTKDISLEECRRCPKLVVKMANSLIENNRLRHPRELKVSPNNVEGKIHVVQWESMELEAQGIAKFIDKKIKSGDFDPGQVLILCPRRQFGFAIRDALRSLGQDVHSFFQEEALEGNPKKTEKYKAQEAFTLLKLLENKNNKVALRVWLGFGHSELRAKQYKRLRTYCEENGTIPIETLERLSNNSISITGDMKGLIVRYQQLIKHFDLLKDKSVKDAVDYIFPVSEIWASPLRDMIGEIDDETSTKDLINRLQNEISQPELPTDVDYIRIMSLHKSKGLSADHVIVTGFVEGLIPNSPNDLEALERNRFIEEQRRLFYVAITRAKMTLILSSVKSLQRKIALAMNAKTGGGKGKYVTTITSTFLDELGPACSLPVVGDEWLRVQ